VTQISTPGNPAPSSVSTVTSIIGVVWSAGQVRSRSSRIKGGGLVGEGRCVALGRGVIVGVGVRVGVAVGGGVAEGGGVVVGVAEGVSVGGGGSGVGVKNRVGSGVAR
jgi:hypothetical protein